MNAEMNIGDVERWASALGGAALAAFGLKQLKEERPLAGAMIAAAAGGLIYRSATAHGQAFWPAAINTAADRDDTRIALSGSRGVHVQEAVTINRAASELYDFWRHFEQLPRFMDHVVSVKPLGGRRSRWTVRAPAGRTAQWDAEIVNEVPGERIGWCTLPGADVISAGSVHFRPAPRGRGTEVRVHLQYDPPAGKVGASVAWILGHEPSQTIREDLRRLKQLMETGEVPTTHGQPRGK